MCSSKGKKAGLAIAVLFACMMCILASCSKKNSSNAEATSWKVGDNVTASFVDDGNFGFELRITGSGSMASYASEKDYPWYSKSGRISAVTIADGVTSIGAAAFAACSHVGEVLLPKSVTQVGEGAFPSSMKVYAYGAFKGDNIYQYSEEFPVVSGRFWHMENGNVVQWRNQYVLFVGNSFTYYWDIEKIFEKIALGAGVNVSAQRIAIGSHTLTKYADPADQGGSQVEAALTSDVVYDYIVLQEQSTRPINNPDFFKAAAATLKARIDSTQKQAKVYLYATWGFPKSANGMTIPEMEGKIRASYEKVASEIGAGVSEVGKAFTTVYEKYPEINLIHTDQQHPSYAGSFLSACVHAATLLGIDPRTSSYEGEPVAEGGPFSAETARILKQVAYETVFNKQ